MYVYFQLIVMMMQLFDEYKYMQTGIINLIAYMYYACKPINKVSNWIWFWISRFFLDSQIDWFCLFMYLGLPVSYIMAEFTKEYSP